MVRARIVRASFGLKTTDSMNSERDDSTKRRSRPRRLRKARTLCLQRSLSTMAIYILAGGAEWLWINASSKIEASIHVKS